MQQPLSRKHSTRGSPSPSSTSTMACRPMNPACSPDQPALPSPLQIMDSYQRHQSPPNGTACCSSRDSRDGPQTASSERVVALVMRPV
jgi:hypothetical protein